MEIIYINSLENASQQLSNIKTEVYIANAKGSIKYLGIRLIDTIFKKLQKKHDNIKEVILNIDNNSAFMYTAIEFGYKHVIYTGESEVIKKLIDKYYIKNHNT